jgi:hypothetical protein
MVRLQAPAPAPYDPLRVEILLYLLRKTISRLTATLDRAIRLLTQSRIRLEAQAIHQQARAKLSEHLAQTKAARAKKEPIDPLYQSKRERKKTRVKFHISTERLRKRCLSNIQNRGTNIRKQNNVRIRE